MKQTALFEIHKSYGAKIVEFAGWQMPVVYSGIKEEHLAVRNNVGLFDVSHMGEVIVEGNEAEEFCQYLTTNDLGKISEKQAQYTLICNENGGVVDDVIVYKFSDTKFLICVNASNTKKDFEWIKSFTKDFDVAVKDLSSDYSQLAIQGPASLNILEEVLGEEASCIKIFHFNIISWSGVDAIVARTGYTGEEGCEIFLPWEKGPELWEAIADAGKKYNLLPCGLGARDTLRLDMAYSLYGNEIEEDISPLEAGLDWVVKLNKGEFIGRDAILNLQKSGLKRRLVGFEMLDKGIARHNYEIYSEDEKIGYVTSGTLSPSLGKSIGLGLVDSDHLINNEFNVDIRGNRRLAKIVSIPFYKK